MIRSLSAANLLLALAVWTGLDDPESRRSAAAPRRWVGVAEIRRVLATPAVWAIAAVILAAYTAYWGTYYFTPWASDVFGASAAAGGAVGVARNWLKPAGAVGAGLLADRAGVARTVTGCFAALLLAFAFFAAAPESRSPYGLFVAVGAVAALATFGLRGIYYALLEEGGVPRAVTGTATGVVSVVGYTPDIFVPLVGGVILDAYPGEAGYRHFFGLNAIVCGVGLAAALFLVRRASGRKPSAPP